MKLEKDKFSIEIGDPYDYGPGHYDLIIVYGVLELSLSFDRDGHWFYIRTGPYYGIIICKICLQVTWLDKDLTR